MYLLDICVLFQPESSLFMVFIGLIYGFFGGIQFGEGFGGILSQVWEGVWKGSDLGWGVFSSFREGLYWFKLLLMHLSLSMLYLMLNIVFFIYFSFSTRLRGREIMGFLNYYCKFD